MGIERMSLELPAGAAREDAEKEAVAQLRAQGVRAWSDLSLQTVLTTDSPGISRYTFTYWVDENNRH
ncbi:hypothetical protein CJ177_42345 [Rhodococcus sp. ACPA1]|nr:hypothetical protein CJ177_42345 [Rhodococcus sp. ACPA1]